MERAVHFARALQSAGFKSEYTVFSGVGHALSAEMTRGALAFMERVEGDRLIDPARLLVPEVVSAPIAV